MSPQPMAALPQARIQLSSAAIAVAADAVEAVVAPLALQAPKASAAE
jgi:hypothetical protein